MEDRNIPRQIVEVFVTLSDNRSISGEIQIDLDTRLSDYLNMPMQFIILKDKDGFIRIINKTHIIDIRLK